MKKKIIIAITGSIAAYKTCDLTRNLVKKGFPVKVMMTDNATRFIGPVTFATITNEKVITNNWDDGMIHIDVKNEAGVFAIIPATANIIGKIANGIADDIVSSSYLAVNCTVIIAPAMNPHMYASKPVQRNLKILKEDGVIILDPSEGEVICGDIGKGKMMDIETIEKILIENYLKNENQ